MKAVPQKWRGVWRRLSLEAADGTTDTESLVIWLQTPTLFADLRVPHSRPDFTGVTGFQDVSPRQAAFLATQEGFAGRLHAEGDRARWERRIDFRPLGGPPDEATLVRSRRVMVETGIHANYVEHWWCEDPWGASDTDVILDTSRTMLLRANAVFLFVDDRRPRPPEPGKLREQVVMADTADEFAALLDCEISLGTITEDGWRIAGSTLPWREGELLEPA